MRKRLSLINNIIISRNLSFALLRALHRRGLISEANHPKKPQPLMMSSPNIFHSLESILSVLNEHKNQECVRKLLDVYNEKYKENIGNLNDKSNRKHPLIVLEGLDCSGKTTIAKVLSKAINAEKWCTPPQSVSHLRSLFDEHPYLRTAYYSLGNYIAALEVSTLLKEKPVVMDRFWHSTAAFALAQAEQDHPEVYKLPEKGDKIYQWPDDLLKPDFVYLLVVSEAVRLERHARRKYFTNTDQEKLLKSSSNFRQNVLKAYDNMCDPGVKYINSDVTVQKTASSILEVLKPILQD